MVSADKAVNAAKWVGIGALALGAAYVVYRVVKLGEGLGDAIGNAWDTAAGKAQAIVARVKDPSGGTAHGAIVDRAEAQRDPTSPEYVPDWRQREGVTVNEYGDYGYGTMQPASDSASEPPGFIY
jgi:uncharacterized protein YjbJ (UPF0337 family)